MGCAGHALLPKGGSPEESRDDRNLKVEGKGVCREAESEGSRRREVDVTNRNLIQGLSRRVIEP
jgi:hypothetical protein